MRIHRRVGSIRGEKAHRAVPPVIIKLFSIHHAGIFHLVKLKHRHQFHRIDPKAQQVRYLFPDPGKSSLVFYSGRFILGKSADMRLIDDQIVKRYLRLFCLAPVILTAHYSRFIEKSLILFFSPEPLSRNCSRVWIQDKFSLVKDQPFLRIKRSVELVRIFQLRNI